MRLAAGDGTYMIHGTNNPMAVGMAITHGCIRMYPEDVAALFPLITPGTKVWLINEPVKVAYVNGELLLEAHPPVDEQGQTGQVQLAQFERLMNDALGNTTAAIHWEFARQALQAASGIPTVVGLETDAGPDTPDSAPAGEPPVGAAPAASPPPVADAAPQR
jgi:L,D-transpeptidase ErfK/SrfK